MTTLMVIYELHLLIFKMSNVSSYCEAYKRLLTPHVRSIPSKRKIFSSSHSLSLFLSFSQHFSSLISFSPLYIYIYIYIIKVIHSHLYFYLSHIYSHFTIIITKKVKTNQIEMAMLQGVYFDILKTTTRFITNLTGFI